MEMHGEYTISADRGTVWDALNEPTVLKDCLEGCESFDKKSESDFEAIVTTKVGPIKMTFSFVIKMSDIDPPNSYTLSGEGSGGASGYAKGSVKVVLTESNDITVLSYTVDASLRGKIGQMGSRVVDSVASRMADKFFKNLTSIVNERASTITEPLSSTKTTTKQHKSYLPRLLLGAVIVALVIFGIVFLITNH
jgi:carbon monoxide dehydrogenase subunit G